MTSDINFNLGVKCDININKTVPFWLFFSGETIFPRLLPKHAKSRTKEMLGGMRTEGEAAKHHHSLFFFARLLGEENIERNC